MKSKDQKILFGILIPNVLALVAMGISKLLIDHETGASVLIFSNFFILPFVMGLISAWIWRTEEIRTVAQIGWSAVSTHLAIALSAIFYKEGIICLLMVMPMILSLMIVGVLIGRVIYRRKNNTLKSTVFGVLLLVYIVDIVSEHESFNMVSDTVIVNAPIEKVWPYVVEYEPITLEENYWLFKIGMPSPVQSTVDGHEVGAGRKCIFSNGYVFEEKMVVYKPNDELTFDILEQPRDPEIMGHIDITRGQFILKDNGDGTTTLIGNSWYKLYVFPEWYFNLWSESITRNVHLRVMEHIKILSEKDRDV